MAKRQKTPFGGVVFGWEREASGGPIGFTQAAAPKRPRTRRQLVTDDSEAHVLVVAPTGSGKGRNLMIPTLLTSHAPAVVIDVKGEAAAVTADARRAMGHDVHIIDPFKIVTQSPDTFNPLDVISADELTVGDDALEIAEGVIGNEGSHRDKFWDNWARSVISAVVEFAVLDENETANMGNIWSWLNGDDVPYNLAVLLDSGRVKGLPYNNIAGFLGLPERETRPSVLGTVQQHIRLFGSPAVKDAMAETSFSLEALREGRPQTIYLVIPPNKLASHAPMLRMWLWALMSVVVQRDEIPPTPTLFIVDEMAHLGPMPIIEQSVTLMRGYGVRLLLLLQNIGQLQKLYPHDNGTIASNCLVAATFGTSSPLMARPMAELLGDITPEQLLQMPDDALAIRRRKGPTQFLTKADYLKDRRFAGLYSENPRYRSAGSNAAGARQYGEPTKERSPFDDGIIASGFRAVKAAGAEVRRLEARVEHMRRTKRARQLKTYRGQLAKAREKLTQLESEARASIPEIFSADQCKLPKSEPVVRTHQPTNVEITLQGNAGGRRKTCKLKFARLTVGDNIEVECKPEDVNLTAYLVAQGEEALLSSEKFLKRQRTGIRTR